jgi:hypothetical protein
LFPKVVLVIISPDTSIQIDSFGNARLIGLLSGFDKKIRFNRKRINLDSNIRLIGAVSTRPLSFALSFQQ